MKVRFSLNKDQLVSLIKKASDYSGHLDLESIDPLAQALVQEFGLGLSIIQNLIIGYEAEIEIEGIGAVIAPDFMEDAEAAKLIREDNIEELVARICARE